MFRAKNDNNNKGNKIREFFTDNGGEYINEKFKITLNKLGIIHRNTPPYIKEPNGLIERINRTLFNKVKALLFTSNLPKYL